VRKSFQTAAGKWDVISDFTPDVTIPWTEPPLRHVAFTTDGDFLVVSAEETGGLAVFDTKALMRGNQKPEQQISTEGVTVRNLLPNPEKQFEHYVAVVLDSGKLCLVDMIQAQTVTLKDDGVTCAVWSSRGKAVAAGLQDGTAVIYLTQGTLKGTIPRPPDLNENYEGRSWVKSPTSCVQC
jgi:nucleoporin NUP159